MVRPKASSKKKSTRGGGVDFKKFKRKLGRKLPPPKNATNTEIKSKAIVLPEQSVAANKAGLAVSKKGLTLKELLQQSSHYNPKVRKDSLLGIRDLFLKFPQELQSNKLAVVEKLRERISDQDKLVRETLYQLFKLVVLPGCKEDNQGVVISLLVAYVFSAMAHLSLDVRLMSFKFLELLVQHYPPTFSLYAEKILQGYEDILRKNQIHMEEKGKLKFILSGLVSCLSLLPSNQSEDSSISKVIAAEVQLLHAFEADAPKHSAGSSHIFERLEGLVVVLVNCFNDLVSWVHSQPALDTQTSDCMQCVLQSVESVVRYFLYAREKHALQQLPSLPLEKLFTVFPITSKAQLSEKEDDRYLILNIKISEIFFDLSRLNCPPVFLEKFLDFIESLLSREFSSVTRSQKVLYEKHMPTLLACLPELLKVVDYGWKARLLQAYTTVFRGSSPQSATKVACVTVAEELLVPHKQNSLNLDVDDQETWGHVLTWMRELPMLLIYLGDIQTSTSEVVIRLLVQLGRFGFSSPYLAEEYDNLQFLLQEFFVKQNNADTNYGPFLRLPKDSQELCVSCLYFFSFLDRRLLECLASCCLSQDLEPYILLRIVEVLHSAYKAGHVLMADHISFFITLVSKFEVTSGQAHTVLDSKAKIPRQATLRQVTGVTCSFLSQMGDHALVFDMLEKIVLDTVSLKLPADNRCALLRILVTVDSRPTRLSDQSITKLSKLLCEYLIDIVLMYPVEECGNSNYILRSRYYLLPCYLLFHRSIKLLMLVLNKLEVFATQLDATPLSDPAQLDSHHWRRITMVVAVFLMISKDDKLRDVLSSCRGEMYHLMQSVLSIQSKEEASMSIEQKHKANCAVEQLKTAISEISP
ncbi:hypothetical protein Droror1_Dr00011349 [Drosera rotundifolia]